MDIALLLNASHVPIVVAVASQGDTTTTKYQVDLGDGVRAIYQNLTMTDEPIQHRYEKPGVYKVTVKAENMAGHDEAILYLQVTGQSLPNTCNLVSLTNLVLLSYRSAISNP